jgi:hypothetical protein
MLPSLDAFQDMWNTARFLCRPTGYSKVSPSMNHLPSREFLLRATQSTALTFVLAMVLSGCGVPTSEAEAQEPASERLYHLDYVVRPDHAARGAHVELTVKQPGHWLREIDMPLRDGQISGVSGDGTVSTEGDRAVWSIPERGGRLRWFALIENKRNDDSYDAYIERDWAVFRGMDVIPSARTKALPRAESRTRLAFDLPRGWSSATPYYGRHDVYEINNRDRRFDTPTGWMVLGDIGVRNERIGHVLAKVAGPTGHSIRRLDMLALMRWNLPELLRVLPDFPERLTFISAGDPMWRGALSGPNSFYVHADRPLISENATSTMLHETVHVGLGLTAEAGADWIVEGFAEYYSLEMLRRSGTIGEQRYRRAHAALQAWGRDVKELCTHRSSGSNTARAVTILSEVAGEVSKRSGGKSHIDDVLRALASHEGKITVEKFRKIVADIAGEPVEALKTGKLPGCQGTPP